MAKKSNSKVEVSGVQVTMPDGTKKLMDIEDARKLYDSLGLLFDKQVVKEYVPYPSTPIIIEREHPRPSWPGTHPYITWCGDTTGAPLIGGGQFGTAVKSTEGEIMCINMIQNSVEALPLT